MFGDQLSTFNKYNKHKYRDSFKWRADLMYVSQIYKIQQQCKFSPFLHWTLINIILKYYGGIDDSDECWDCLKCRNVKIYALQTLQPQIKQWFISTNEGFIDFEEGLQLVKYLDGNTNFTYSTPFKHRMIRFRYKQKLNETFKNGAVIGIRMISSTNLPIDNFEYLIKTGVVAVWADCDELNTVHTYEGGGGMGIIGECSEYGTTQYSGFTDYIPSSWCGVQNRRNQSSQKPVLNTNIKQCYDWFEWGGELYPTKPIIYKTNEMCNRWVKINIYPSEYGSQKYMFESNLSAGVEDYILVKHDTHLVCSCPLNKGINFLIDIKYN